MYQVYLLQSVQDQSYYIGYTSDIADRMKYHNAGRVKSTSRRIPWQLIGFEEYDSESKARWREYVIKHSAHERYKFIEKLNNMRP